MFHSRTGELRMSEKVLLEQGQTYSKIFRSLDYLRSKIIYRSEVKYFCPRNWKFNALDELDPEIVNKLHRGLDLSFFI